VSDPAPPARPAATGPLSAREAEIAVLIAGGLTNKEIAGRLQRSQRTIDVQVMSILDKLGATNRTQVALKLAVPGEQHGVYFNPDVMPLTCQSCNRAPASRLVIAQAGKNAGAMRLACAGCAAAAAAQLDTLAPRGVRVHILALGLLAPDGAAKPPRRPRPSRPGHSKSPQRKETDD